MIKPDAKCVVNGSKLNALIKEFNVLVSSMDSEKFDVVDNYNQASTRHLITGQLRDIKDGGISGERDELTAGGTSGDGGNRDTLNMPLAPGGGGALVDDGRAGRPLAPAGGAGMPLAPVGRPLAPAGGAGMPLAPGGRPLAPAGGAGMPLASGGNRGTVGGPPTDEFGNTLGGSGQGMPLAPSGAGNRGTVGGPPTDEFGNTLSGGNKGMPLAPTSSTGGNQPPLPGAPPRTGNEPTNQPASKATSGGELADWKAQEKARIKRAAQRTTDPAKLKRLMEEYERVNRM